MFNFYKHCLFCFVPLLEIPSGIEEHVFPKSIYGFWRIYAVCETCMKYFDDNIDHLPLQNPQILKAIEQLRLPNTEKYYEQIKYKGTDTIDGIKVKIYEVDPSQQVSFKYVEGIDEAVEEVKEVVNFLKEPEKYTRLGSKLPK